jgi:CMP-N,N'-diacetyllegionaminic acid synthase
MDKTICIIPARKGSKGIKNKNIIKLGKKPLLLHSLNFAKKLKFVSKIIVSTDSKKYAKLCRESFFTIDKLRPKYLARDNSKSIDLIRYELNRLENLKDYKYILLLQPTCPFRSLKDFNFAFKMMKSYDSVYTINQVNDHPSRMYIKNKGTINTYLKFPKEMFERRQKLKKIYIRSGSMYFFKIKNIFSKNFYGKKVYGLEVKGKFKTNIDTIEDLVIAKHYIK